MNKTYKIIDETLKDPIVSVAMLTYGHANFIREAIDSVLMQKANFRIQLVIAEDCSPDNTKEIILDYQKKYPDIIKLVLQNNNVGATKNNLALFENLEGKYVAALEGDDYWTDSLKLQKQFEFLEHNPKYSMCFHNVSVLNFDNSKTSYWIPDEKNEFFMDDIIDFKTWFIPTGSILFRNDFEYPKVDAGIISGDVVLCSILCNNGVLKLLDDNMSVYRRNIGSATSTGDELIWLKSAVKRSKYLNSYFNYKYANLYKKELFNYYGKLSLSCSQSGNLFTYYYLTKCLMKISDNNNFKLYFNYYLINSLKNFFKNIFSKTN